MPNGQYWVFNETPDKMRPNENALSLNSSPIHVDELGKLVHGESVGGTHMLEACQEVSMATLRSGTTLAHSPTRHRHTEKIQWNKQNLPKRKTNT